MIPNPAAYDIYDHAGRVFSLIALATSVNETYSPQEVAADLESGALARAIERNGIERSEVNSSAAFALMELMLSNRAAGEPAMPTDVARAFTRWATAVEAGECHLSLMTWLGGGK